ncbi:MAG: hypothetical protein IJG83_05120, partial [Thermoguttaceae bacterium]|nr:hypothetical protein [Thermoguttaceae bacterium]
MRNHTFKKITALLPAVLATAALLSVCGMAAEPVDAKSSEGFVMVSDVMPNVLQEIRYFSRVTRDAPLNTERCVQFAYDFCEQSRDRTHLSLIG